MNADKILPILCRYLKDTDNHLLANPTPLPDAIKYNLNEDNLYTLSTP